MRLFGWIFARRDDVEELSKRCTRIEEKAVQIEKKAAQTSERTARIEGQVDTLVDVLKRIEVNQYHFMAVEGDLNTGGGNAVLNQNGEKMSEGNNGPSFGGDLNTGGGDAVFGDKKVAENITEGDVAGDVVSGQKAGTVEGDMVQNRTDSTPKAENVFTDLFESMKANAPELEPAARAPLAEPEAEAIDTSVKHEIVEESELEALPEVNFESNQDHPAALAKAVQTYAMNPEYVPAPEEQKSFYQRCRSSFAKYATKENMQGACDIAANSIQLLTEVGMPGWAKVAVYCFNKFAGGSK